MVKADLGVGFAMADTILHQDDLYQVNITPKLPTRHISFAISKTLPLSTTANDFMSKMLKK
jgi:hypothetical protein